MLRFHRSLELLASQESNEIDGLVEHNATYFCLDIKLFSGSKSILS